MGRSSGSGGGGECEGEAEGGATTSSLALRNRYWVLRHGKSIPNAKGLIVSSPENGILEEYRLAPEGVDQARLAGRSFQKAFLSVWVFRVVLKEEDGTKYWFPGLSLLGLCSYFSFNPLLNHVLKP
ncbi:unnamed protein product [Coffea canephora]|uniref:DH200=94 genomic scaffold, scaffold_9581 n=1 Tax=Coffea canephora TaxID=49390 RepID=A0A068VQQ4_COFCA|nr:unnamed protein product [Coffea canephora]